MCEQAGEFYFNLQEAQGICLAGGLDGSIENVLSPYYTNLADWHRLNLEVRRLACMFGVELDLEESMTGRA